MADFRDGDLDVLETDVGVQTSTTLATTSTPDKAGPVHKRQHTGKVGNQVNKQAKIQSQATTQAEYGTNAASMEVEPLWWTFAASRPPASASCSSSFSMLEGPHSLDELHKWPLEFQTRLAKLDGDFMEEFWTKAGNGINLISDYSGAGCIEQAAGMIQSSVHMTPGTRAASAGSQAPEGQGVVEGNACQAKFRCLRACDNNVKCQFVLGNHVGPLSPLHVFDDILNRVPACS